MHSLTVPADKKITISEDEDPVKVVVEWAKDKISQFHQQGIDSNRLIFDPGLGFGKTASQSFEIIKRVDELKPLGLPLFIGHSEKSMFALFTDLPAGKRDIETTSTSFYLTQKNVEYIRVHDFKKNLRAVKLAEALKN